MADTMTDRLLHHTDADGVTWSVVLSGSCDFGWLRLWRQSVKVAEWSSDAVTQDAFDDPDYDTPLLEDD